MSNNLTIQEVEASYLARFDLGPGYPQMRVDPYIRRLYRDDSIEELALEFAPRWTNAKQRHLDESLKLGLCRLLQVDLSKVDDIFFTFTGSVALDRAVAACGLYATRRGRNEVRVVTTSPSIDIMKLFLAERPSITTQFIESRSGRKLTRGMEVQPFVDAIASHAILRPAEQLVVLLTSPENPTGEIWSDADLRSIASACEHVDGIVVVDHTFAVSGVQVNPVPRIWDLPGTGNWIGLWDTGKTFGLNEDKLGVVITGSPQLRDVVSDSLSVIQFGIARRQKLFFSALFDQAFYQDHILRLRSSCIANLEITSKAVSGTQIRVRRPVAGSLALLDLSELGVEDEVARRQLLSAGVGTVAANVFFHSGWQPRNFLRIALARDPDYFSSGLERLMDILTDAKIG